MIQVTIRELHEDISTPLFEAENFEQIKEAIEFFKKSDIYDDDLNKESYYGYDIIHGEESTYVEIITESLQ